MLNGADKLASPLVLYYITIIWGKSIRTLLVSGVQSEDSPVSLMSGLVSLHSLPDAAHFRLCGAADPVT